LEATVLPWSSYMLECVEGREGQGV
jgi:hypothetical protein